MLTLCAGMNHCFLMKDKATALVLWTALICFQKRALIANLLFYVCLPVCLCPFFLSFLPSFFFSLLSSFFVTKVATWKEMQVRQPWYGKLFCFSKKTRPLQKFLDFIALPFGRAIWLIPRPGTEPELQQWKPRILTTAAAAKSLQSCPTLCDPIDGSPRGSPIPGILQARTLEWVAISFSNAWNWKLKVKSLSGVWLLATPLTAAHQAPLSMGFSRQEYWSGVPLPSPILTTRELLSLHFNTTSPIDVFTYLLLVSNFMTQHFL